MSDRLNDPRRAALAATLVESTNQAVARWLLRMSRDGMTPEEAIRSAYIDGVSEGLNMLSGQASSP